MLTTKWYHQPYDLNDLPKGVDYDRLVATLMRYRESYINDAILALEVFLQDNRDEMTLSMQGYFTREIAKYKQELLNAQNSKRQENHAIHEDYLR